MISHHAIHAVGEIPDWDVIQEELISFCETHPDDCWTSVTSARKWADLRPPVCSVVGACVVPVAMRSGPNLVLDKWLLYSSSCCFTCTDLCVSQILLP